MTSKLITFLSACAMASNLVHAGDCHEALSRQMIKRIKATTNFDVLTPAQAADLEQRRLACFSFEPLGIFVTERARPSDRHGLLHHEAIHANLLHRMIAQYDDASAAHCCIQGATKTFGVDCPSNYRRSFINNEVFAIHRTHCLVRQMERRGTPHDILRASAYYKICAYNLAQISNLLWRTFERRLRSHQRDGTVPPFTFGKWAPSPGIRYVQIEVSERAHTGRTFVSIPVPVSELDTPAELLARMLRISEEWRSWLASRRWLTYPTDPPVS